MDHNKDQTINSNRLTMLLTYRISETAILASNSEYKQQPSVVEQWQRKQLFSWPCVENLQLYNKFRKNETAHAWKNELRLVSDNDQ